MDRLMIKLKKNKSKGTWWLQANCWNSQQKVKMIKLKNLMVADD